MKNLNLVPVTAFLAVIAACAGAPDPSYSTQQRASVTVVTSDEVSYQPLNPARGDASPKAGVLWGDITKDVPSGVLLQFAEGFSSPPHIHNITYRAIVINGEIHNDDPDAANMWMGPGTFWTQPAGEVHITSAKPGVGGTGFLEILEGPYLVQPDDMAFDSGEQPLNLASSNMVWMGADEMQWISVDAEANNGPMVTLLWGDLNPGQLSGSLVKLPAGYEADLSTIGGDLKAVIIEGEITHSVNDIRPKTKMSAGGFLASAEGVSHLLSCGPESECTIYIRTEGKFQIENRH